MAASKVAIANIALTTYLGKGRINSLTENTTAAQQIEIHYDEVRKEVLSEWTWSFITKRARLAVLVDNDRDEWAYRYQMPINLLRVRWVNTPEIAKTAIWEREVYDTPRDISGGYLYSDTEDATMEYTEDSDDPTIYPPKVTQAMAALLASRIAIALTETAAKMEGALREYARYLDEAKVQDIEMEEPIRVLQNADYLEAR